jgi:photosystem II stability/assembly factor-like uncharacterized protein
MKKVYILILMSILFNCSLFCQELNPDIIISKDTTIGAGIDSISSNLVVNENVTLTILPGAILYFKKDTCSGCSYKIIVKGNIVARGTTENPIVFTSIDTLTLSGFTGVSIEKPVQSNDTIWFDHCIFENAVYTGYNNGTLYVNQFSNVKITDCIIRNNGNFGIYNRGFISIINTSIYGGNFGGLRNYGTAKVFATSIFNNYAGGIYNNGNLLVTNSTIYHNQARTGSRGIDGLPGSCSCYTSTSGTNGTNGFNGDNGGGILNDNPGVAEIINSTIARNYSGDRGVGGAGGRGGTGTCIKVDPITHNITTTSCYSASGSNGSNGNYGYGGGIYNSGTLKLNNSIVAYNKKCNYSSDEIYGTVTTSSNNIIMDKTGATFTSNAVGNLFVDPMIDLLQYNGGNTPTCALQLGSPAIDGLSQGLSNVPVSDQRGFPRLGNPDVGSYEFTGCVLNEMKATWNSSPIGQDSWIYNMSVVNDSIVWVKDMNADTISITTNGGVSWISKPLPIYEGFPRAVGGICALSATNAYCIVSLSDSKGIYKTTNGGVTWVKQTTGFNQSSSFPDVIYFWNENDGVAIGDADPNQNFEIYTTTNGGILWNRVPDGNMPNGNKEATLNDQSTFRIIGNSVFFITNTARIFKSLDKGLTWSVVNTPFYNTSLANSTITFDFKDNNNGLVSYCSSDGATYKMYGTTDGGQTWETINTNNFYQRMKFIPTSNAYYSLNANGGATYSCDDGQTWVSVSSLNTIKLRSAGYSPTGKIFWGGFGIVYTSSKSLTVSANTLTIAAPANSIKTFDITSNTNWTVTSSQPWLSVGNINGSGNATITLTAQANPAATNRTATVSVSEIGVTTKTITVIQDSNPTGKINWTHLQNGLDSVFNSVFFIDANLGYVVGNGGTIIKTTNGGSTWNKQASNDSVDFYSVYFTNADTGYAVGHSGGWLALAIYEGGSFRGWVGVGGQIFKTTNGGNTWVSQSVPSGTSLLTSVYFTDSNTGYAVGYYGIVLKTINGGNTWVSQTKGTGNYFYSVCFIDSNTGYTVGYSTTVHDIVIMKTTDGGNTWNDKYYILSGRLWSVFFTDINKGFAVGDYGHIIQTLDGGNTWDELTSGTIYNLNSVYFTDANTGYAVGEAGTILKTTNGGKNWDFEISNTQNTLNSVYFINTNIGYSVGSNGTILKYNDTNGVLVLSVSANALTIAAPVNSTKTFDISSNTDWSCSSNQTWLNVNKTSGSGNSIITLTAQANPANTIRTATVTISGNGITTKTILVTQDGKTTGMTDISEKDFKIYPNPVTRILYFSYRTEKVPISIFDLNGRMVLNEQTGNSQINVGDLPDGFYTIKIIDKSEVFIGKFVKQ